MKKILLAGIGAAATTAEKSKEILDDLVKKGEDPADVLKGMSPEQIAALKDAIAQKEAADAAQDDEEEAPDEA